MPCSGTEDVAMLTSSSNVGEPGVWVFQVDGTDIIPACPNEGLLYNSGNKTVIFSSAKTNRLFCIPVNMVRSTAQFWSHSSFRKQYPFIKS